MPVPRSWHHAWKDAAAEPADLVYFAGDNIYEYATDATSVRWPLTPPLPSDFARETDTLGLCRQQYGLYKTDPHRAVQPARQRRHGGGAVLHRAVGRLPAAQQRVIDTVAAKDAGGFVVLTGDIHRNYHLNVLSDFEDPDSRVVGVEFAGTSISSGRDGGETDAGLEVRKRANPHLVSADLRRGHLRCRITHDLWTTQVRAVDRISSLDYRAWTSHTLVTAPRRPGIEIA